MPNLRSLNLIVEVIGVILLSWVLCEDVRIKVPK